MRSRLCSADILPILHWASNYSSEWRAFLRLLEAFCARIFPVSLTSGAPSARLRRTIHGGFAEFTHYPALEDYLPILCEPAQAMFRRWEERSKAKLVRRDFCTSQISPSRRGTAA